jgi:hypothetical protein
MQGILGMEDLNASELLDRKQTGVLAKSRRFVERTSLHPMASRIVGAPLSGVLEVLILGFRVQPRRRLQGHNGPATLTLPPYPFPTTPPFEPEKPPEWSIWAELTD